MKIYAGGCHCGAVQFEVETDLSGAITCNCSHCHKKGFVLVFVPNEKFKLLSGKDNLAEYLFNKKSIRHLFCKTCGAQAFAEGIAFPQTAVNVRCLTDVDLAGMTVTPYNGKDI
jgi:hypothetical protein